MTSEVMISKMSIYAETVSYIKNRVAVIVAFLEELRSISLPASLIRPGSIEKYLLRAYKWSFDQIKNLITLVALEVSAVKLQSKALVFVIAVLGALFCFSLLQPTASYVTKIFDKPRNTNKAVIITAIVYVVIYIFVSQGVQTLTIRVINTLASMQLGISEN